MANQSRPGELIIEVSNFNDFIQSMNGIEHGLRALTLRHLRCLVTLAEERHFGRAAERLAITQPALSNAMRQIERLVGTPLLARQSPRFELTLAGIELLRRAQYLVHTVDLALLDMAQIMASGQALVRLGVVPSAAALVTEALQAHPPVASGELKVDLLDLPSSALLEELRQGRIDLAVVALTEPPAGLDVTELFEDPLVLVLPRSHALADGAEVAWRQLRHERLVLFASGSVSELAGPASAQFARIEREPLRVLHSETLYGCVRGGLALGLMPRLYTTHLSDPALVVRALVRPVIERRVALLQRPGPQRSEAAERFAQHLRERLSDGNRG
jgi:LysR family hydrogen peroxide-inducible transcriptional activator